MGKKYKNLFEKIITEENFQNAFLKTRDGKRKSLGYLDFKEYGQFNLKNLREEVADCGYERSPFRDFFIHDPKLRLISSLPFKDRIVQHALNNVIEPIYEPAFLPYTFACRPNKGTHAGIKYIQSNLRRGKATHFLKTDFSKYFPSINCETLYNIYNKKIKCYKTIDLMQAIQTSSGVGIPIGSLKSQLSANIYGSLIDNFIHFKIKPMAWARYMDDVVILGNDSNELRYFKDQLEQFAKDVMQMKFSKWSVAPINRGINFLGYRIWPKHKLLRKQSVTRAKRAVKHFKNKNDIIGLNKFLAAWTGHASWADTNRLFSSMELKA